jgi:hypothetical protein
MYVVEGLRDRVWLAVVTCAYACHHPAPTQPAPVSETMPKEDDEAAHRKWAADMAALRRKAAIPDVGVTVDEARQLCVHDGGNLSVPPHYAFGCQIGDALLFACDADDSLHTTRCTRYENDAVLADVKQRMASAWGPPDATTTVDGFPGFEWSGGELVIAGYAHGVLITRASPPCRNEHGVCVSGPATIEIGAKCSPYEVPEHGAVPRLDVTAIGMMGSIDVTVTTFAAPCASGPTVSVARRDHTITLRAVPRPARIGDDVWTFHVHVQPLERGAYDVLYEDGSAATLNLPPVTVR